MTKQDFLSMLEVIKKMGYNCLIKPDVLIKSKRKSLSLSVNNDGEFVVHAPKQMSLEQIFSFIQKKEDWVKEKKAQVNNIIKTNQKLFAYEEVLFLGKVYNTVKVKGVKECLLENNFFCIPDYIKEEKYGSKIKFWLTLAAEDIILDRLDYFAELMGLDFNSVKITSSRAKWGSCDSKLNLMFNFKMVMLPPILIDYIIIHELSHILELNHSQKFWDIVGSVIPTYKKQRETLKNSGFLLNLFAQQSKLKKNY